MVLVSALYSSTNYDIHVVNDGPFGLKQTIKQGSGCFRTGLLWATGPSYCQSHIWQLYISCVYRLHKNNIMAMTVIQDDCVENAKQGFKTLALKSMGDITMTTSNY